MTAAAVTGTAASGTATGPAGARASAAVRRLEHLMGDPADPHHPFSSAALSDLDRREEFPADACRELDRFGLAEFYVPASAGGRLTDFSELVALLRTVARRDVTVAVAHGKTFLGAASVWVSGSAGQAARLGERVRAGDVVSWALTERDHGADLLATDTTATPTGDGGWRLSGEKWLINNATRGDAVCVLARTDPDGGPRGHGVFLVERDRLLPGAMAPLPKVRTHGIRGADISGLVLSDARLPADALVGREGDGVETVLRALQLTRTLCVALSLGAADHALSLAAAFAADRALYDRTLADLPSVRRRLGEARVDALLAEALGTVAARAVHELPGEMSVLSAVAKAAVPSLVQGLVDRLAELMGLRGFLEDDRVPGGFAKLDRDHRIVEIFDGSTAVNRHALITQFPRLARCYRAGRADLDGLAAAARPGTPPRPLDPARLRLASSGGCSVVQAVPEQARRVRALVDRGDAPERVGAVVDRFAAAVTAVHDDVGVYVPSARGVPASAFSTARRYELCAAGAACLALWCDGDESARRDGTERLHACLLRVLALLGADPDGHAGPACDALAVELLERAA